MTNEKNIEINNRSKVNYTKDILLSCLEARKRSIESELETRKKSSQSFSDWKDYDSKELEGRLAEIINTKDMLLA